MGFEVAGADYDRFMGRYSRLLAPQLADFAGIAAGQRVLDVGSGPGALTAELVARLGRRRVVAVDPSAAFVAALRERLPDVEAAQASAEALPFGDDAFDAALAQLVVHFMADPVAGLREMARVTRTGGVVAACVWDHAGERSPLARVLARGARARSRRARRVRPGGRARGRSWPSCSAEAGLRTSCEAELAVAVRATPASRSGGSRSRSASGPRARTSPSSRRTRARRCASAAASCSRGAKPAVAWAARGVVA